MQIVRNVLRFEVPPEVFPKIDAFLTEEKKRMNIEISKGSRSETKRIRGGRSIFLSLVTYQIFCFTDESAAISLMRKLRKQPWYPKEDCEITLGDGVKK
mgnify:CR=1 FL=1